MKNILLILLCCFSLVAYAADEERVLSKQSNLLIKFSSRAKVPLYSDGSCQFVIDTLCHDIEHENFLMLQVDSCNNIAIHVQPQWSLDGTLYPKTGWVFLSDEITIYAQSTADGKIQLYSSPSYSDSVVVVEYRNSPLPVILYQKGWIFTEIYNSKLGIKNKGWLSPIDQCDAIYTTCN